MADTRNWKWDRNLATPNLLPGQEEVAWAVVKYVDAAHVGDAAAARGAGAGDAGRRAAAAPPPRVDAAPPPRADAAPDASAAAAVAAGVVTGGAGVVVPPVGEQRPLCGCT